MKAHFAIGLTVVLLIAAAGVHSGESAARKSGLRTVNWTVADTLEPGLKPGKQPSPREPSSALQLQVSPLPAGGGRVRFCRIVLSGGATPREIASTPPSCELWTIELAEDGSLRAYSGEFVFGLRQIKAVLNDKHIHLEENGKSCAYALPENGSLWPAALAECLASMPQARGQPFSRQVLDPLSGKPATFIGQLTAVNEGGATLSACVSTPARDLESFVLQLDPEFKLKSVLMGAELALQNIDEPRLRKVQAQLERELAALKLQGKDGRDLTGKIQAFLSSATSETQIFERTNSQPIDPEQAAVIDTRARELEDELLQENAEQLLAACRMLVSSGHQEDRQRLLVLVARTGAPGSVDLANACFEALSTTRQVIACRMLARRAELNTVETILTLLSRKDPRIRDPLFGALYAMAQKDAEARQAIALKIAAFLEGGPIWLPTRPPEMELDAVINLLCEYFTPRVTFTLQQRFSNATIKERAAMVCVAAVAKDEIGLHMVRTLLLDPKAELVGLRAACHAAGDMEDLECVPSLIPYLQSKDQRLAKAAHEALVKISGEKLSAGSVAWAAWWNNIVKGATDPAVLIARVKQGVNSERIIAMRTLAALKPHDALNTLIACAADPEPFIRYGAARALARCGGVEILPVLLGLLRDKEILVREGAHTALKHRTLEQLPLNYALWAQWYSDKQAIPNRLQEIMDRTRPGRPFVPKAVAAARGTAASRSTANVQPRAVVSAELPLGVAPPVAHLATFDEGFSGIGISIVVLCALLLLAGIAYLARETLRTRAHLKQARTKRPGTLLDEQLEQLNRSLEQRSGEAKR